LSNVPIYIHVHVWYTVIVRREIPNDKKSAARSQRAAERGPNMKYSNGMWHYKGKTFATLHEALLSVWPKK